MQPSKVPAQDVMRLKVTSVCEASLLRQATVLQCSALRADGKGTTASVPMRSARIAFSRAPAKSEDVEGPCLVINSGNLDPAVSLGPAGSGEQLLGINRLLHLVSANMSLLLRKLGCGIWIVMVSGASNL
mmetsp:Transcript_87932/g.158534  ORF Transcript_87932/g.158534 Transcript_87932/m.158534 type:complete len:130 (+) Transcript_87932:489-878(+)